MLFSKKKKLDAYKDKTKNIIISGQGIKNEDWERGETEFPKALRL